MDFNELKIIDGIHWDVFLHEDQTVPGRLYFWFKGEKAPDMLDASPEALQEFYIAGKRLRDAVKEAFQPDMFNYLTLNNHTHHLHVHFIPRYSRPVELFGYTFEDRSFGEGYKRNPDFKLPREVMLQIKEAVWQKLV